MPKGWECLDSPDWADSELMELKQFSIYQVLIYTEEKQAYYLLLVYKDVIQTFNPSERIIKNRWNNYLQRERHFWSVPLFVIH